MHDVCTDLLLLASTWFEVHSSQTATEVRILCDGKKRWDHIKKKKKKVIFHFSFHFHFYWYFRIHQGAIRKHRYFFRKENCSFLQKSPPSPQEMNVCIWNIWSIVHWRVAFFPFPLRMNVNIFCKTNMIQTPPPPTPRYAMYSFLKKYWYMYLWTAPKKQ